MKDIHHAQARLTVPAGFSGWWCERCERACPTIPEEAGSPAKCPHCRKYTVVWVPPSGPSAEGGTRRAEWKRWRPTDEKAKELFERMKLEVLLTGTEAPPPPPGDDISEYIR